MLLVDNRAGSKDLAAPLQQMGLSVELLEMPFGDVAFVGKGSLGVSVDVGIEFKQFEELLASIRSGRLVGHQLPGMILAYEFRWLVIEGEWRVDAKTGLLLTEQYVPKKRRREWLPARPNMTASELDKQLLTLQLCGGLNGVYFTPKPADTLRILASLYHWFCDRDMDAHTSHLAVYQPASLVPTSEFCKIVRGIDGIGRKASLAAERKFKTVRRAMRASIQEWAELETLDDKGKTRRLGEKVAGRIDKILG